MPDAPDPLPMCRELWQELRRCRASATIPEVSAEMLDRLCERIIDSKVRPLVEALINVTACARELIDDMDNRCGIAPYDPPDERIIAAESALKAAGVPRVTINVLHPPASHLTITVVGEQAAIDACRELTERGRTIEAVTDDLGNTYLSDGTMQRAPA